MNELRCRLLEKINTLLAGWKDRGLPARASLHEIAEDIMVWRKKNGIPGLWDKPPFMVAATLDDGFGHGLEIILKFATAIGVETQSLGLMLTWEKIVACCQALSPGFLGLTVLQLDTEDDLILLKSNLPENIKIIAGGPVFKIDSELADRAGIDYVARDVGDFLKFFISLYLRDAKREID